MAICSLFLSNVVEVGNVWEILVRFSHSILAVLCEVVRDSPRFSQHIRVHYYQTGHYRCHIKALSHSDVDGGVQTCDSSIRVASVSLCYGLTN
jgi:hypothetical protein